MRWSRSLFALSVVLAPLGLAAPVTAQSPEASARPAHASMPRATAPDGQSPLEGTTWRLIQYRREGLREVGPEVAAWMTLRAGRVSGSGGCSELRGSYARMGSAVRFRMRAAGELDCVEQSAMVELGLRRALGRAAGVQVEPGAGERGSQLVVRDSDGVESLRFAVDHVGSLTTGVWQLESYSMTGGQVPGDPGQPAVLAFRSDPGSDDRGRSSGQVDGSTGCNGFVGRYEQRGDVLTLRALERTDAPCPDALTAQEAAMMAVLEAPALTLDLPADRLVLTSADTGERLELVTSTPLEGSTWLLTRISGRPRPNEPVTLRLVDGQVTGEGPCGPYAGRYDSDGVFISFSGLSASELEACPERGRQRELLAALERAVLLDRDQPQLRLLDAGGRIVARFARPAGP